MLNNYKIILACILASVVLVVSMLVASNRRAANAVAEERHARRAIISKRHFANDMVRMQIMTPEETTRLQNITDSVLQTHAISDADLDWMLTLLNKPENGPENSTQMHYIALGTLEYVKTTTPQQQDKVFNALLPLLTGNDTAGKTSNQEASDKISADETLAVFKVTKSISYLQAQLQDPSPYVKTEAKRALRALAS